MTTDFLLSAQSNIGKIYLARTGKYLTALNNPKVLEKFEIERIYWERRNIDWKIVTNENFPVVVMQNIKWVYGYFNRNLLIPLTDEQIEIASEWMLKSVSENIFPIRNVTRNSDTFFNFVKGTSKNILRHLIARKLWEFNMEKRIWKAANLLLLNFDCLVGQDMKTNQ